MTVPLSLVILFIATTSFLAGTFSMAASWSARLQEKKWALIFSALWVVFSCASIGAWFFLVETPFH